MALEVNHGESWRRIGKWKHIALLVLVCLGGVSLLFDPDFERSSARVRGQSKVRLRQKLSRLIMFVMD